MVLAQMVKNDMITKEEKERLEEKPIKLQFKLESHKEGIATYFREYLSDYMKTWVKNKKADGTEYDIYRDGLKIYTTIDSECSSMPKKRLQQHIANLQEEFFIDRKTIKMHHL